MPLEQKKQYTVDDIYELPDGVRAELIDGEMYMMAPPGFVHQNISALLHNAIFSYIHSKHGECVALAAPFAVFLNDDDQLTSSRIFPLSVIRPSWMKRVVTALRTG